MQSKAVKRHKMALGSDHPRLASPRASRLPSLPSPCAASSHGPTWSDHSSAPVYRNSTLCNQTHLVFCIHHNLALSRPPRSRSRTYSRDLDAFNSLSGPHSRRFAPWLQYLYKTAVEHLPKNPKTRSMVKHPVVSSHYTGSSLPRFVFRPNATA